MKYILKSIILLLLVFSNSLLNAQANTINFTLSSENITVNDQNFTVSSAITKTGNILTWTQVKDDFSETLSFSITDSSGNWDENTSQGSKTYTMIFENYQCGFILSNQDSKLSAILTFTKNDVEEEKYTFDINAITYH
jgi:hypothetical protein